MNYPRKCLTRMEDSSLSGEATESKFFLESLYTCTSSSLRLPMRAYWVPGCTRIRVARNDFPTATSSLLHPIEIRVSGHPIFKSELDLQSANIFKVIHWSHNHLKVILEMGGFSSKMSEGNLFYTKCTSNFGCSFSIENSKSVFRIQKLHSWNKWVDLGPER